MTHTFLLAIHKDDIGPGKPYDPYILTTGLYYSTTPSVGTHRHYFIRSIPHGCSQTWLTLEKAALWYAAAPGGAQTVLPTPTCGRRGCGDLLSEHHEGTQCQRPGCGCVSYVPPKPVQSHVG